jgi:hypothetical protein
MIEGQGKILGPRGQHAPHVTGIATAKLAERRVTEHHIIGVAGRHGFGIQALESLVETGDQGAVGFTHLRVPWMCAMKSTDGLHDSLQMPPTLSAFMSKITPCLFPPFQYDIPLSRA